MKQLLQTHLYDKSGTYKLSILRSPLFVFGLVLKLYIATIFAGENFSALFVPFLKHFTLTSTDPYQYFFSSGILEVFPYPLLMLYIMSVPGWLFGTFLSPNIFQLTHTDLFLFHLPILAADIAILVILSRWLKNQHRALLWLYWLSPVLIYINYIHSQLDAIPIALTFVFLYFLFKGRWGYAMGFLGAAIATKFHIIILVPFTIIYLWRKRFGWVSLGIFATITAMVFLLINNTHLLSPEFITIVFDNREQMKVFDLAVPLGTELLYIIPLAYLLLTFHAFSFPRLNRDTFVMFLGFAFGILTLGIPPQQGWYYWVLPFIIYFYAKFDSYSKLPFIFLCIAYFTYFALTSNSDYMLLISQLFPSLDSSTNIYTSLLKLGLPVDMLSNLSLTLLQATLLFNIVWLYKRGIEESRKQKLYNMPYLIGIAGDSGSGKTTFTNLLQDLFGGRQVAVVPGDAMHKWERGDAMWDQYTHLDPRANQLHNDLENIRSLQTGEDVYRRQYDHKTGTFTTPEKLESKTLIVFEGLHSFFLSHMRQMLDLKIFIHPDEQLRQHWKIKRDITKRGYTKEKILAQLKARTQDAEHYIATQAKYADITFSLKSLTTINDENIGTDFEPPVYLEITCDNTINLEPLLSTLTTYVNIEHTITDKQHIVSLTGTVSKHVIEHLSYSLVPELSDITTDDPAWLDDHMGIVQLFTAYYILETLHYNKTRTVTTAPKHNSSLQELATVAKEIGGQLEDVQGAGGNVSIKLNDTIMAVKASGMRLGELQQESGFVGIDFTHMRKFFNDPRSTDDLTKLTDHYEQTVTESRVSLPNLPETSLRPSIETGFHAILDTVVIHTHSVYTNILTCSAEGQKILEKLFPNAAFIPYHTPGVDLTFAMSAALKDHPYTVFFLENHGIVVTGKTVYEAKQRYQHVEKTLKKWLKKTSSLPSTSITTNPDGTLASKAPSLTTFVTTHKELVSTFLDCTLFPDQIVYGTKVGMKGEHKPITIDTKTGIITYNVSFKEAQAFIENFVAWLFILSEIQKRPLTVKTLSEAQGNVLVNLESEKYRQKMVA